MGVDESLSDKGTYGWTETAAPSCDILTEPVARLLTDLKAHRVLDAGCGNGAMTGELGRRGFDIMGVDGDAEGVAIAGKLYPTIEFRQGFFEDRPPGTFDAVVSTEVVEHLYAPHELASYAHAALEPGGHLVISTPYHGYLKNLALSVANGWDSHFTAHWCGGHIKFWSRRSLSRMLEQAGFRIVGFKGVGRVPFLWKSMILVARRH